MTYSPEAPRRPSWSEEHQERWANTPMWKKVVSVGSISVLGLLIIGALLAPDEKTAAVPAPAVPAPAPTATAGTANDIALCDLWVSFADGVTDDELAAWQTTYADDPELAGLDAQAAALAASGADDVQMAEIGSRLGVRCVELGWPAS